MDVRLSPEQQTLRDAAAQVVERLRPRAVAELDDRERTAKLAASVAAAGWREVRTAADDGSASASAVEAAIIAEELGRGLADAAFLGPTLAGPSRAARGEGEDVARRHALTARTFPEAPRARVRA